MLDPIERLAQSLAQTSLDHPRPFADLELSSETHAALNQEFGGRWLKPAAVLVGILPGMTTSIVLTRRSEDLKNHPGQISFPGGRREEGDVHLAATALRESEEEIALPMQMVEVIGYLPDYPTITGYRVTPVVGLIDRQATAVMQPDGIEATELIYLPLERALDPAAYDRRQMARNGIQVPVFHLRHEHHDVWGATAGMLYQMCLQVLRHENGRTNK